MIIPILHGAGGGIRKRIVAGRGLCLYYCRQQQAVENDMILPFDPSGRLSKSKPKEGDDAKTRVTVFSKQNLEVAATGYKCRWKRSDGA